MNRARKETPAKRWSDGEGSYLRLLHENLKGEDRATLFQAVAERVRTGLLTDDEAELIAGWFEAIAAGGEPKDVLLGERRGRKRGANTTKFLKGKDVAFPDHADLCWTMRRAIAQTGDEDQVFRVVAKHFDKSEDHIRRIYRRIGPTLAPDPDLGK